PFVSPPIPGFSLWGCRPSIRSRHQRRYPAAGSWVKLHSLGETWDRLDTSLQEKTGPWEGLTPFGCWQWQERIPTRGVLRWHRADALSLSIA
ncbi:MAG: hypothetical protein OXI23_02045, partial [Gemmatimonadota bacterium]|nr:hypothetical protein [Gemmatimonadota bacterium]